MLLREEVNEADRTKISSDFGPGDMVFLPWTHPIKTGIVVESSERRMVLKEDYEEKVFDAHSEPTLSEVLTLMTKVPDLKLFKEGVIISRVSQTERGEYYRQYAEITELVQDDLGRFQEVEACILNGHHQGSTLRINGDMRYGSLRQRMSQWEMEE